MTPPAGDWSTTRASYDGVAATYAARYGDVLASAPLLRAILTAFTEQVGDGLIADIACGPGHVAASLGRPVVGVDLSPAMVAIARGRGVAAVAGSMDALPLASGRFGGVLSWWSIFHASPAALPGVLGEFARVLVPGGLLSIGTHAGSGSRRSTSAYGHPVDYAVHYHSVEGLSDALRRSGFTVESTYTEPPAGTRKQQVLITARSAP